MFKHSNTASLILILPICLTACQELKARDEANAGKDALLECNFESAFIHFTNAHEIIDDNNDINIGLATSELLLTLNSKDFTNIIYKFGFTQNLQEFCLQNINPPENSPPKQNPIGQQPPDACASNFHSNTHNINLPHSCANTNQCNYIDHIQPTLTWNDIIHAFNNNRAHLEHISQLFAQTADALDSPYALHDVFNISTLNIHPADLFFFASLIDLSLLIVSATDNYKNSFSVAQTLQNDECLAYAAFLNQNMGIADSPVDISEYKSKLLSALKYINKAFQQAKIIREDFDSNTAPCPPQGSLLQWSDVPYGVMDNIVSLTSAYQSEPFIIQDILSPDVMLDLNSFLSALPSRAQSTPFASCREDELHLDLSIYIRAINDATSPDLLDTSSDQLELHPDLSYRLSSGWRQWTPLDLF